MEPAPEVGTCQKTIRVIAVSLLLITALATRLSAPFRMDAINDEMIHISTYHPEYENRKFLGILHRILLAHSIRSETIARIDSLYNSSYLLQRLQYFIRDAHPPLFAVFAELVNCAPGYKLQILRTGAVLASLIFILLLYLAGKEYSGHTLGLWLAGLATVCVEFRMYSGVGRPYVFGQMMEALVLYLFLRRRHAPEIALRRFLFCALLAQATDWVLWPVIAPMILIAVIDRCRAPGNLWTTLKESWWYVLSSLALVVLYRVQVSNPVISIQLESPHSLRQTFDNLSLASPFAELGNLSGSLTGIGAVVFLVLCAIGLAGIAFHSDRGIASRSALVLSALAAVVVIIHGPALSRVDMMPVTVLIFSAAIALDMLFVRKIYSELAFAITMAVFLAVFLVKPQDPYTVFLGDTPYSLVAKQLSVEMKPGDVWFGIPYFYANDLYLYGAPAPLVPDHDDYSAATLKLCETQMNCYVFSNLSIFEDPRFRNILTSPSARIFQFRNRHVLFLIPHPFPQAS